MDSKLQEVLLDYGLEGYGLYFYCLELIAANVEKHNLTFELEHDARIIARNTGSTVEKVQQMMGRFIELKLFENTNGVVTCLKMLTRTDEYTQKLIKKEIHNGNNDLDRIPTMSRQCPDSVGIKSVLIEENRIEENRVEESNGSDEPTPSSTKKPKRQTLKNYIAECKEIGVDPIPLDSIAFRKADTMGIPHDIVDVCWFKFKDYWIENKKRSVKTDWVLAFSNCLEGNGYDCYAQNQNGEIYLTTKGKNAQKLMVAENG